MKLSNVTRKQHFVSQAEQRLNATPGEKIYEFNILQRGFTDTIRLSEPKKKSIGGNLMLDDLFTFSVEPKGDLRENFERLFQGYEDTVSKLTRSLLEKATEKSPDVATELLDLFSTKLMNFARNPYCVQKVLNTFSYFKGLRPTNVEHNTQLQRVLTGRNPRQKYLCDQLGISEAQYREWLATLYMLLEDFQQGQPNFLNQAVVNMFNSPETSAAVMVNTYTTDKVLLSDRAVSSNINDGRGLGFDFNLCGTAFVRYIFVNKVAALEGKAHPSLINSFLELSRTQIPTLHIHFTHDDLERLCCTTRPADR